MPIWAVQEIGSIQMTVDEVGEATDGQENKQYRAADIGQYGWNGEPYGRSVTPCTNVACGSQGR